jgi:hypothetical protein
VDLAETLKGFREAATHYREGEIEGAYEVMEEHLLRIKTADIRALRTLKQSLFWVHYTEYVVVAVTFVLALSVTIHFIYRPRIRLVGTTRYVPIERGMAARSIARRGKAGWTRTRMLGGAALVVFSLVLLSCLVYLGLGFSEGEYQFAGLLTLSESKEGPGVVSEVYGEYPVKISVVDGTGEIHVSEAVRAGTQAPLLGGEVFHLSRLRIRYNAIRCRIEGHTVELEWTGESGVDYLARDGPKMPANLSVGRISGKSFGLPGFSVELRLSR